MLAMSCFDSEQRSQFDCESLLAGLNRHAHLTLDSRAIQTGDIFVAIPGLKEHGLVYGKQAIEHGASAVIYDPAEGGHALAQVLAGDHTVSVQLLEQPHLKDHIGLLASSFYQHPSQHLDVIGITGTNGKTSCSHFISQAITGISNTNSSAQPCAYIGTLGWGLEDRQQNTINTTPDTVQLQRMLSELKQQGAGSVAIEASSHGLEQNRLQGTRISGSVFTNLGRDHLDYHKTIDQYLHSKLKLFGFPDLKFAVINQDDAVSEKVMSTLDTNVELIRFSTRAGNRLSKDCLTIDHVVYHQNRLSFDVCYRGQVIPATVPLVGEFNISNVLATIGVMSGLGFELETAVNATQFIRPVPGRMENITGIQPFTVLVDYAHSPDALSSVLHSVRLHTKGKIALVFGCGGNRDQGKRIEMGAIAADLADSVVVTDDNPRFEDGDQIIGHILEGLSGQQFTVIRDRKTAIETVISQAQQGDTVVIAGKGHESYQDIQGQHFPFDDRQIARSALKLNTLIDPES
ncbi:MAG: UDP-N-acetylmuramoyl-L-alanyl-D-glutamate--2,6-diaminopimelate ligase [Gammaproteobacteria bacterium]|nr:UDP-N-acetylmuramoyl-L-alanyl-D-glutamate--2,6-diaminopimelate ligase [Gammaproteobacteria bacterium]